MFLKNELRVKYSANSGFKMRVGCISYNYRSLQKKLMVSGYKSAVSRLCLCLFIFGGLVLSSACQRNKNDPEYKAVPIDRMMSDSHLVNFDVKSLVSLRDTICGMSLKDGVADTLSFGTEIYGFCSSGCKNKLKKSIGS